jgi:hypothetical protein
LTTENGEIIPLTYQGSQMARGITRFSAADKSVKARYASSYYKTYIDFPAPERLFKLRKPGKYRLEVGVWVWMTGDKQWSKVEADPVAILHTTSALKFFPDSSEPRFNWWVVICVGLLCIIIMSAFLWKRSLNHKPL